MSASGTEGVKSEMVRSGGLNWNSVESFGMLNPGWDAGSASLFTLLRCQVSDIAQLQTKTLLLGRPD